MSRRAQAFLTAALGLLAFHRPAAAGVGPVGLSFVPIPGCRAVDTRGPAAPNGGPALGPNEVRNFVMTGTCGIPADALGLAVNLTVVSPAAIGFAVLYAGDAPTPPTSDLAFIPGRTRASFALTALASDGSGTLALANASSGSANYLIDVLGYFIRACTSTITVTNPGTASGTVNAPFSQTFTGAGGVGGLTFSTASPLPAGLALAANGTLAGTPTQAGSFPITVTATDANGCTGSGATYTLVISCQTITVTNPATTTGTANVFFTQTFTQTGGFGTTTFSTASALPIGMALAANGVLSGTPTQAGAFDIVVVATDANGCTGTGATYHLVVGCQTIGVTNPGVTIGTAGTPFSQTFTQAGAIGTATFTTASPLPAGLFLAANGVLSGTPTQVGTFPIVVKVTDGNLCVGTGATYTLVIGCQTIAVSNPGVASGTADTPFSQTFTQVGAIGSATFTTASTLPAGLALAANGTLSGKPTQTGTFPIVVTVTDANGCTGTSATYTLVIGCQTFSVEPTSVPPGTAGTLYPAVSFKHAGGINPVTFTETGALPTGMNFVAGLLLGTPTQTGSFPFTVTATDVNGCTASRDYVFVVSCVGVDITLAPASLPTVVVGSAFPSTTFTASGGTGAYTFQQIGALPNGMQFLTDTLSGTPTQTGAFPITVVATDAAGCVGSQEYVVTVTCVGITITVDPPNVPSVAAGSPFGPVTFTASGGTGPYTFVKAGVLPTGMNFGPDTLSGSPTQQGTFPFTITATDANGCSGSTTYSLVVTCPTITVTNPGTTTGTVNTFFTQTFGQTGGNGTVTFTTASALPTGMSLSSAGVLSGTPTQSGNFPIVVKATDANGCTGNGPTYTLVISCQTITVTNPVVNSGADGVPFGQTFTQTGAIGAVTFSLASGALPGGWTLTPAGVLANATPTPVSFSITVKVTDANGCTGTGATYTVTIAPSAGNDVYAPAIVGNMSIDTSTGTTFSVLANDSAGTTATLATPAAHGTVVLAPAGTFTYAPNRGYEGPDSFTYTASVGGIPSLPATVSLTVTGVVWFVNDNPGACVSSCDGRQTNPYTTLDAFQAVNDGVGTNPKPGHSIFLYESPIPYTGPPVAPVALLNNQKLVGQDFAGTFSGATGLTVPDTTVGVPVLTPGAPFSNIASVPGQNIVSLATDNVIRGLTLSPFNNAAVAIAAPANIGALGMLDQVTLSLAGSGSGIGLALHTGILNVQNSSITGTTAGTGVALSGPSDGSAIFTNTPVTLTGGRLLDVQSRTGGIVSFDPASVLTVSGGVTDAIVLQSNVGTTLDLLGGFTVTTANGRGFFASNTGVVTIGGTPSLINATNGAALDVTGTTIAGAPTFSSVSSTNPSTQGILLSSVSGGLTIGTTTVSGSGTQRILVTGSTVNASFGNTTLNGGTDAVSLQNNSGGTRTFGSLTIGNTVPPSAVGFRHAVGGGSTTVGLTSITNGAANGVDIQNSTTAITFSGVTITKTSGTGVNLAANAGLITFGALSVSSPSAGAGLVSAGSSVSTSGGTIAVTGGPAVSATNTNFNASTLASASSATSTMQGVSLTGCSGSLAMSAGLITGAAGVPFAVSGGTVSATYAGGITQLLANPMVSVSGGHATGTITFQTGTLSASNGTGLLFDNADGTYVFNGPTSLQGGDAGIDIVNGSSGAFSFGTGTSITSPTGTAFTLNSSNPTVTYSGNITKGNAGLMVDITSQSGGTVTFQTGTLSATAGTGVLLDNADGTVSFNGTTTLNGGDAGVDIQNGSAGTVTFANGTALTNPSGIAYREDTSTATVNYNGTITKTNNANNAVDINAKTGGATTFSGAITASTTTANAVDLTNTGGTVTFRGGLAVTTTSGVGFNATGAGATVNVCDENPCVPGSTGLLVNTLTSGTGTALNVANTAIGANNVEFRSISSNGATNGIVLNVTGATGGLKVKGNGGACTSAGTCSGGAIQNAAVGVSLTSTTGVSIDRMFIQNTTSHGVRGTLVNGFSFTNGLVDNSGTALGAEAANIAFNTTVAGTENNLSGVVTITGNTLTNAYYHGVDIFNFNGTISDATISTNTITSSTSTATSKGLGVRLVAFGSASTVANVTKATIASNIVSNFPSGTGILASGGNGNAAGPAGVFGTAGSGVNIIAITGNRVAGFSAANRFGAFAIAATVNGKGQGSFDISSNGTVANPVGNSIGTAISLGSFGSANVTANIANNVIVANNSVGAQGIGAGTSSTWGATDTPSLTVTISNNTISQTDGNGILVTARDATGTLRAKIQNNTVAAPLGGVRPGIRVDAGNLVSIDDSICLNISGNTSAGSGGSQGLGLRKQGTVSTTNDFGVNGMAATSTPGVEAYVDGLNPAGNGTLLISATSGFSNCSFP